MSFPQLEVLMSAYYHQDWVELGMWETLELYLHDSTGADAGALTLDLSRALGTLSEAEVKALLDSYYCAVSMEGEPGGYRGWLEEIARRVSAGP
ncbi:contact-dependent growth inhibition system immunity protein [Nocardioides plantarum]|uniref:Contact-dependent growth inhibition system immunity protein n=1 Tax=Nocardioides plantarum TaxID=29299 RepID=A0ABV5KB78_9ACTN|nr:contact-dependent growth inhibition system immunity protein [Nocardioides plantarum]